MGDHYYEKLDDGVVVPRHFVKNVKASKEQGVEVLRPTRITDVRKWWKDDRVVVPSVTSIMGLLAKHALVDWKINEHLKVAWDHFAECNEGKEKWISDVKRLTQEEMDKAPEAGTSFHQLMEDHFNGVPVPAEWRDLCAKVVGVIEKATGVSRDAVFNAEVNFVSDKGYGGQIDLHIDDVDNDWVIDFKTKLTADKFKPGRMAYEDHSRQLSAYREYINPKAKTANVFVCLETGEIDFHEHKEADLQKGLVTFNHCLAIWKNEKLK